MSPTQIHANKDSPSSDVIATVATTTTNVLFPPPLKINKESHFIKKPSSSQLSSSSSASSLINTMAGHAKLPPQRHPVIIYTHSPKVIHTNPRDFMALVQKLTGLQRSEDDASPLPSKMESSGADEENKSSKNVGSDDNESSSVLTDENNYCSSNVGDGQVNSCFMPPPNPYVTNSPVFTPNSTDFLCPNQPFFNYKDSSYFGPPSMRGQGPSNSAMDGGINNEFSEY